MTIEGENPVEVTQGHVLYLKGGAVHGFKNTGAVTATIIEFFWQVAGSGRRQPRFRSGTCACVGGTVGPDVNAAPRTQGSRAGNRKAVQDFVVLDANRRENTANRKL